MDGGKQNGSNHERRHQDNTHNTSNEKFKNHIHN
jgi:hypothetical protein